MSIISGGDEGDRERGAPRDRPAPEQSRRKLTLAIPTKRTRHVSFPAYAKFAKIRLNPFVGAQPLQSSKTSSKQTDL